MRVLALVRLGMPPWVGALLTGVVVGLIARAKESVRDVTVGRVKGLAQRAMPAVGEGRGECFWITPRLIQAVKENPLPVALIGLAATVLMVRTLRMGRAAQ